MGFRYEGAGVKMESELPHLVCIDDDILSTGITMYHLTVGISMYYAHQTVETPAKALK